MATFRFRRDTAARWSLSNPILVKGEPGYESTTGKLKIGDGVTPWRELEYFSPYQEADVMTAQLSDHVSSLEPHPVYDDGPSLVILYENAKV